MPPDRRSAVRSNVVLSGGLERNMPRFAAGETCRVVDCAVNVQLGAFLALLVLPIVLIRETQVDPPLLAMLGSLVWAASRSGVRYRKLCVV